MSQHLGLFMVLLVVAAFALSALAIGLGIAFFGHPFYLPVTDTQLPTL